MRKRPADDVASKDILKKGINIARTREIEGRLREAEHYLELAKQEAGRA